MFYAESHNVWSVKRPFLPSSQSSRVLSLQESKKSREIWYYGLKQKKRYRKWILFAFSETIWSDKVNNVYYTNWSFWILLPIEYVIETTLLLLDIDTLNCKKMHCFTKFLDILVPFTFWLLFAHFWFSFVILSITFKSFSIGNSSKVKCKKRNQFLQLPKPQNLLEETKSFAFLWVSSWLYYIPSADKGNFVHFLLVLLHSQICMRDKSSNMSWSNTKKLG